MIKKTFHWDAYCLVAYRMCSTHQMSAVGECQSYDLQSWPPDVINRVSGQACTLETRARGPCLIPKLATLTSCVHYDPLNSNYPWISSTLCNFCWSPINIFILCLSGYDGGPGLGTSGDPCMVNSNALWLMVTWDRHTRLKTFTSHYFSQLHRRTVIKEDITGYRIRYK